MIEAVFEDPALKAKVFAEIAPYVNKDALLCSNTSTLPITELAEGVDRPADFIGLHFFSPVDKMPLVEIIKGKETSDVALAKAYDVVQQIRKTPIVVNDSRGFYTSRVIGYMVNEGMAMLAEGVPPVLASSAATTQAGYPAAVLQLSDELNLELMAKIAKATKEAAERGGNDVRRAPGHRRRRQDARGRPRRSPARRGLLRLRGRQARLDLGRPRRAVPASPRSRSRSRTSRTGCCSPRPSRPRSASRRASSTSAAAANIGSIMGIGFPPMTGGAAQFMTGYEDARDRRDRPRRLRQARRRAGRRRTATGSARPPCLRDLAAKGGAFPA